VLSCSIIGRTVPNALADKLGHFNVVITFASLTVILVLGVLMPTKGEGALIAFTALFGVSSGAVIALAPVLCAAVSPIEEIGSRTGAAYFLAGFAALTGSPIGGQLIVVSNGDFFYTFLFAGVCCALGTSCLLIARTTHIGLKLVKI
jgi:MFS family permease